MFSSLYLLYSIAQYFTNKNSTENSHPSPKNSKWERTQQVPIPLSTLLVVVVVVLVVFLTHDNLSIYWSSFLTTNFLTLLQKVLRFHRGARKYLPNNLTQTPYSTDSELQTLCVLRTSWPCSHRNGTRTQVSQTLMRCSCPHSP